jgi:hypothetical protein
VTHMTDATTLDRPAVDQDDMTVLPNVAFSAHCFSGSIMSNNAAGVGALAATQKAANRSIPTILQQIAIYRRLQRARQMQGC